MPDVMMNCKTIIITSARQWLTRNWEAENAWIKGLCIEDLCKHGTHDVGEAAAAEEEKAKVILMSTSKRCVQNWHWKSFYLRWMCAVHQKYVCVIEGLQNFKGGGGSPVQHPLLGALWDISTQYTLLKPPSGGTMLESPSHRHPKYVSETHFIRKKSRYGPNRVLRCVIHTQDLE